MNINDDKNNSPTLKTAMLAWKKLPAASNFPYWLETALYTYYYYIHSMMMAHGSENSIPYNSTYHKGGQNFKSN